MYNPSTENRIERCKVKVYILDTKKSHTKGKNRKVFVTSTGRQISEFDIVKHFLGFFFLLREKKCKFSKADER